MNLFRRNPEKPIPLEAPRAKRACRFNTYCRTRSFVDQEAQGIVSTYYEAIMNNKGEWKVLRVEEKPSPKNEEIEAIQTIIARDVDFETVLEKLYAFETGAEELNYAFGNSKEDLGLDHFHVLAHAEELAFNAEGKIVQTENGRIVSEGKFKAREKQAVLQAHQEPAPEKKLPRGSLAEMFAVFADRKEPIDLLEITGIRISHEAVISYYSDALKDIKMIKSGHQKIIEEISQKLSSIEISFSKGSFEQSYALLKKKKMTLSWSEEKDRAGFKINGNYYGAYSSDKLEEAIMKAKNERNIETSDSLLNLAKEMKFFGSYLYARVIFHLKFRDGDLKKNVLKHTLSILEQDYNALPKTMEKPAWASIQNAIVSPLGEEKLSDVYDRAEKTIIALIKHHEQLLQDFNNRIGNKNPPLAQLAQDRPKP